MVKIIHENPYTIPLKTCPFCGGKAKAFYSQETADWHITCEGLIDSECAGIDNGLNDGYINKKFACEAWNKRN